MSNVVYRRVTSPVGDLILVASPVALMGVHFEERWAGTLDEVARPVRHDVLDHVERELDEYFRGLRRTFTTRTDASGTPFRQRVWAALSEIPPGETRSYSDIARAINHPLAVRAVGTANAVNPIAIIVPCHRVIGANGRMSGYGGGTPRKAWLLEHEGPFRREASAG